MTTRSCHSRAAKLGATAVAWLLTAAAAAAQVPAPATPVPAPPAQPPNTTAVARFTPPPLPVARPVFAPRDPDGIYAVGETVAWTATLPAGQTAALAYTYKIRKNNDDLLEIGTSMRSGTPS